MYQAVPLKVLITSVGNGEVKMENEGVPLHKKF